MQLGRLALNDWRGGRVSKAFLEFSRDGQRQTIALDSDRFTLGRASGNDLGFPEDGTVSGHHAVIEQKTDGWLIRDLDSVNGTSVNGQKISGPQMLGSGDSIMLGQTQLAFRVVRPEQSPSVTPPTGYLDITEEWGRVDMPSVPDKPVGSAQRLAEPQSLQPSPGPGQAGLSGAERRWDSVPEQPDTRTSRPEGGPAGRRWVTRGHGRVRGTARGVQVRQEANSTILSFRIERYDGTGNRLPPVGAELIGFRTGRLSDDEEVEVSGRWSHGTLQATKIINLSTGAQIRGTATLAVKIAGALIVIAVVVALTVFIIFFIHTVKAVGP